MSTRIVYHVVKDDGWAVKREGICVTISRHDKKGDAVRVAKELAKQEKLGQVKVHKANGKLQTEYTYGKDPEESKG